MNCNYKNAEYTDRTDKEIPEKIVMNMLFEESESSGVPAINYEIQNIKSVSDIDKSEINIKSVTVKESEKDSDKIIFEVRTSDLSVTAPENMTEHDTRVLNENEIPYHYYDIALLN